MSLFDDKKRRILSSPPFTVGRDLSPKGSLDIPSLEAVMFINNLPDYITTSSCSGRVSVYMDTGTKGIDWLLVKHEQITVSDVLIAISSVRDDKDELIVLKCEAFILHVLCRDLHAAQSLHQLAMECGYRESGISVGKHIMVAVRTTSFGLEMPVAVGNRCILDGDALAIAVNEANKRIRLNFEKIDYFLSSALNKFSWPSLRIRPSPCYSVKRWGHCSVISDSSLITLGGYGSPDISKDDGTRDLPVIIEDFLSGTITSSIINNLQFVHASLLYDKSSNMYLLSGGRLSPSHPLGCLRIFNHAFADVAFQELGNPPAPRWGHSLTQISPGLYLLYGGRDATRVFSDAFSLTCDLNATPPTCEWRPLSIDLAGRFFHSAAPMQSAHAVIVHGGALDLHSPRSDSLFFTIDAISGHTLQLCVRGNVVNRFAHTLTYIGAKSFVLIGGTSFSGDSEENSCHLVRCIYDATTDLVSLRISPISDLNVGRGRVHHQTLFREKDKSVIVIGGGMQCLAFGASYCAPMKLATRSALYDSDEIHQKSDGIQLQLNSTSASAVMAAPSIDPVLLVPSRLVKRIKVYLEKENAIERSKRISQVEVSSPLRVDLCTGVIVASDDDLPVADLMAVPVTDTFFSNITNGKKDIIEKLRLCLCEDFLFIQKQAVRVSRAMETNVQRKAKDLLTSFATRYNLTGVLHEIPNKFEIVGDVLMVPESSLRAPQWDLSTRGINTWREIAAIFGLNRVARKARIDGGQMRESKVELLYSSADNDDGWTVVVENRISYGFYITKIMFCSGNCSERIRAASFPVFDKVVVDLYCGIGYYTLPFLVHGKAKFVHSCELNPVSVEALKRNLTTAQISNDRYRIYVGDNEITAKELEGVADHVSLGLLPSSEAGWPLAALVLRKEGGILHIHENVNEDKYEEWLNYCLSKLKESFAVLGKNMILSCLHIETVKSYSPRVNHIVADISCTKAVHPD